MGKVDIHMCIKQDGGDMGIPVKLEVFEGPLDLLLHLIDKNKIDIYDIPIVGKINLRRTENQSQPNDFSF